MRLSAMRRVGISQKMRLVDWGTRGGMVASPEATPATTQNSIQGLYAHFIGGKRVQPEGTPDLVRNNPAASDQVLGGMRSADLDLVNTAVRTAAEAWPKWRNTPAPTR